MTSWQFLSNNSTFQNKHHTRFRMPNPPVATKRFIDLYRKIPPQWKLTKSLHIFLSGTPPKFEHRHPKIAIFKKDRYIFQTMQFLYVFLDVWYLSSNFFGGVTIMTQRMGASETPYPSPSASPQTTKASEEPHPAARRPARMASAVVPVGNKRT